MKFILHSDQSIKLTAELDTLLIKSMTGKKNPRIGYIPSALDVRRKHFEEKLAYYSKIGFPDVDLLEPTEPLEEKACLDFFSRDLIHLSGGQVGPYRDRLLNAGLDIKIASFLEKGGVVLGVSAGAMILQRTFELARLHGDKGDFKGLGFLDFEVSPHTSEYFPVLKRLEDFSRNAKKVVYALNDGDALTVNATPKGSKVKMFGNAKRIDVEF